MPIEDLGRLMPAAAMAEPPSTGERPSEAAAGGVVLARLSDRALFVRASGDEAAFAELVRRYREPLRRHAARYVGDGDAEDVVQQALVNASLAMRREPEREIEPKPWLYKVTTNAAIDHRRARAARPLGDRSHSEADFETLSGPESADPHEVVSGRETVRSLVDRMQGLAPNQRRAATARFLEGRSHDEIAGELGVSKGAARELIHRARRNLREAVPAIAPLTLIAKLRHAVSGLFAGSAPAAKLAAGAAVVAVAAGGGAAVVAAGDGGDAPSVAAGQTASPASASFEVPRVAPRPRMSAAAVAALERGERPGRDAAAASGKESAAGSTTSSGSPSGSGASTDAATAPATTAGGSPTDAVQNVVDDLGNATEQIGVPAPEVDVPELPTPELPVKPPSLPDVGLPGGG